MWQLPGENAYLVSTWESVAEATSRVEDFSNHFRYTLFSQDDGTLGALETGTRGPDVFAGADPPAHTAQRKIFFSELVQSKIEALEPYVAGLTDELLDVVLRSGHADAAKGLAHPLPMRVIAERVIGFRDPDLSQIREWVFDGSRLVGGLMTLEQMASLSAGDDDEPNRHRERAPRRASAPAGRVARAEPVKVAPFIEEVLRFESPFRFHPRTAARSVDLAGVEIPQGTLVMLLWSAANRDEAVFEHPDEITLDRHNSHLHFGFGRGIHHCVGAPLARLEARVLLTRLLERTKWFALDHDRPHRWADSIWIRRHEQLPIVFERR